ncbi:isocitrate lyase/PEP mutase family protein [Salipiger sp.]|uniref:isocitrate lyase/PEP mutase family protein n=1 Tax=Salipiger sp. TaxID=2078585 RepID=UPI003A97DB3F
MKDCTSSRQDLKGRLQAPGLTTIPGVYDMISARIADRMGFAAIYMTGYGTVASSLGIPDAGLASYREMLDRVETIAQGTATPLVADADTGFGGLLNLERTVRGYERAGAAAMQIEDQEFPKKCGHMLGRRVIPAEDMVAKIRVARDTRDDPNFLIIARTDARTSLGLDEAMRRGDLYAEAGADVLFIESPESADEMQRICAAYDLPLLANMVEGGRTPVLSRDDLERLGYSAAIFPSFGFLSAGHALRAAYGHLRDTGSSAGSAVPLHDFGEFNTLMGFPKVYEFEQRWGVGDPRPEEE